MFTHIDPIEPQNPDEQPGRVAETAGDGTNQVDKVHQVTTPLLPENTVTIGHATAAAAGADICDRNITIAAATSAQAAMDRTDAHRMDIEKKVFDLLARLHISDEEQRTIQRDLEELYVCTPHTQESHECISAEVKRICLKAARIINDYGTDPRVFGFVRSGIERTTALIKSPIIQDHYRICDPHTLAKCLLHRLVSQEDATIVRRIEEYLGMHFSPTCSPQLIYEMNQIILAGMIGLNRSAESLEMSTVGLQASLDAEHLVQHTLQDILAQLKASQQHPRDWDEHTAPTLLGTPGMLAKKITRGSGTPLAVIHFSAISTTQARGILGRIPVRKAVHPFIAQQQAIFTALLVDTAGEEVAATHPAVQTGRQLFQRIKKMIVSLLMHEGNDPHTIFQGYHTAFQAYLNHPQRTDPLSFLRSYAATLQAQCLTAEQLHTPSVHLQADLIAMLFLPAMKKMGDKDQKMLSTIQELATKMEGTGQGGKIFLQKLRLAAGSYAGKHRKSAQKKAEDKARMLSRIKALAETLKNPQHLSFTAGSSSLLGEIWQLVQHLCLLFGPYVVKHKTSLAQKKLPEEERRVLSAMQTLEKSISTLGARFPLKEESDDRQFLIEALSLELEIDRYNAICQKNVLFFSNNATRQDLDIRKKIQELDNKIRLLRSLQEGPVFWGRVVQSLKESAQSLRQYIAYHPIDRLHAAADRLLLMEIEALLPTIEQTPDLVLYGDKTFLQKIWSFSQRVATYNSQNTDSTYEEEAEKNLEIHRPYLVILLSQLQAQTTIHEKHPPRTHE